MFFLLKLLLSPKAILGMAVGAAAVWFSDPERGPERRAQALSTVRQRGAGDTGAIPASTTETESTLWTPDQAPAGAVV